MNLIVRVVEIRGNCPVYKLADTFKLEEGYRLVSEIPLCMHSLASLMPHYNALRVSAPADWGLAGKQDSSKAYVQCLDPAAYTGGGTVVFEVSKSSFD